MNTQKIKKSKIIITTVLSLVGLLMPIITFAATTPSLGAAATYGILSDTFTNPLGPTTINGDVGFTSGPAVIPLPVGGHPGITYPNYGSGGNYSLAGTAQAAALVALNGGANTSCDFTFAPGSIDLAADTTHGPLGVYTPGVYCTAGAASAFSIGTAGISLNGAGTFIFRNDGALNTVTGSSVAVTGGASVCDIFWNPNGATTLNHDSTFRGTVIPTLAAAHDITIMDGVNWFGRALTFGHTVTTPGADAIITVPTCGSPTLQVIKHVINDNGGTTNANAWTLSVTSSNGGSGTGSALGTESGTVYTLQAGKAYSVTESGISGGYNQSSSSDCTIANAITNTNYVCTITNDDIAPPPQGNGGLTVSPVPPLIDIIKVPTPPALPLGPGLVTYDYTVSNIGPVAMSNIAVVDDKCSPTAFVSGDTNNDSKLDTSEIWKYRCATTISQTTTNTVTATGQANGFTATHIASAVVVVGAPIIPPLITNSGQVLGATVVVTSPGLPKTGFPTFAQNIQMQISSFIEQLKSLILIR